MKCIKCKTVNINKANYCKKCAYHFSEAEQKAARSKTLIGKIEKIEKLKSICDLSIITGHILFKIGSILLVLVIGIYFWITNGINLKILNSDNYEIQYNTVEQEYYLMTKENKIPLDLYVPNRTKDIVIIHYDENNNVIESKKYDKDEDIILETKQKEYYILTSNYLHNKKEAFKFYVLKNK